MAAKVILVSACLLGVNTKYNGGNNLHAGVCQLQEKAILVPFCPEQLGGLSTPRDAAEIQSGDGHDVLAGRSKVKTKSNQDCTAAFLKGAQESLYIARKLQAAGALVKARSPSCGSGYIYAGDFSGAVKIGDGVTAAAFKQAGLPVFTEEELEEFNLWLSFGDS